MADSAKGQKPYRLGIIMHFLADTANTVCLIIPDLTRSSAVAEGPRDELCQLKSCQLPHKNEYRFSNACNR